MMGDVCDGNEFGIFANETVCVEVMPPKEPRIVSDAMLMEQIIRRHVPEGGVVFETSLKQDKPPALAIAALVHDRKWIGLVDFDTDRVSETLKFLQEQLDVEYENADGYDYQPFQDRQFCTYAAHCKFMDTWEINSNLLRDVIQKPTKNDAHNDDRDRKLVKVAASHLKHADGSEIPDIGEGLFAQGNIAKDAFVCSFKGQFYAAPFTENDIVADRWCWLLGSPAMKTHLVYQTLTGCLANKINDCKVYISFHNLDFIS
jgi:hypothetical protein